MTVVALGAVGSIDIEMFAGHHHRMRVPVGSSALMGGEIGFEDVGKRRPVGPGMSFWHAVLVKGSAVFTEGLERLMSGTVLMMNDSPTSGRVLACISPQARSHRRAEAQQSGPPNTGEGGGGGPRRQQTCAVRTSGPTLSQALGIARTHQPRD